MILPCSLFYNFAQSIYSLKFYWPKDNLTIDHAFINRSPISFRKEFFLNLILLSFLILLIYKIPLFVYVHNNAIKINKRFKIFKQLVLNESDKVIPKTLQRHILGWSEGRGVILTKCKRFGNVFLSNDLFYKKEGIRTPQFIYQNFIKNSSIDFSKMSKNKKQLSTRQINMLKKAFALLQNNVKKKIVNNLNSYWKNSK